MSTAGSAPSPPVRVGTLIKTWRSARRLSQLDLALQADVSSRHLSFVETGRAQPSRDMVMRLAETLSVPLRERNTLLLAAGFAPVFRESDLGGADLALARRAVSFILKQLEPYPAMVIDRLYDLIEPNGGAVRLLSFLFAEPLAETNLLRLVFRADGLRGMIANWEEVAAHMLRRLQLESACQPAGDAARALISEVLALPGVPRRWRTEESRPPIAPLLTVTFRKAGRQLRFFSTITTFGTPGDITLEELRIECFYPADEATETICREFSAE